MGRASEILNRFVTNSRSEISENRQTTLWPRFAKLNNAITKAITALENSSTKREFKTFDWSGRDTHNGELQGETDGILLDLHFKGNTVSDRFTESYLDISGMYVSKDGKKGFVQININDKSQVAAYWLEKADGLLRLEQVTDNRGNTYDADQLGTVMDDYIIPNTNIRLPKQCLKLRTPIETQRLNPKN